MKVPLCFSNLFDIFQVCRQNNFSWETKKADLPPEYFDLVTLAGSVQYFQSIVKLLDWIRLVK